MATQKTVLNNWHHEHGAKMIEFGGWDMPVNYTPGIVEEHLTTRKAGGLFDVSHMGRFFVSGKDRMAFLQTYLTNNAAALAPGKAQYTIIQNDKGGAVDDAYLYRVSEGEYMLVVNASNREKDLAWFHDNIRLQVTLEDRSEDLAMMALQGPCSEQVLQELLRDQMPPPGRNNLAGASLFGQQIMVSRTGYTGEPICFELFVPSQSAQAIWDIILSQGKQAGIIPVGLGARDTLRMEASLPLYGHELGTDKQGKEIPIFACPLAKFAVSFADEKGDFLGKTVLQRQAQEVQARKQEPLSSPTKNLTVPKKMMPIEMLDKGVVREGYEVKCKGTSVGFLTSGTMVPYWKYQGEEPGSEKVMRAIGIAYVDAGLGANQAIEVNCRGRWLKGTTVVKNLDGRHPPFAKPIYREIRE